jgi:hypothetical protein
MTAPSPRSLAVPPRSLAVPPRHAIVLPVMGIATRFESSSPAVIDAVREAFGAWGKLGTESRGGPAARVRIDVVPGDEGPGEHAPVRYHSPDADTVELSTPGSSGRADARSRTAAARVTEALLADRRHFRYSVLEALTLALITRLDREPLHAGGLVRGGSALLLAGPSGTGKSTLVYAAARAGFSVLAEDAVFLQLDPFRVWGMPSFVHLSPDARRFFPELDGRAPELRPNGKMKIAVSLEEMGAAAARPMAERAGVCLLARGDGPPRLEPLSPDEVIEALAAQMEEGFDHFAGSIGERIRAFAAHGGWRLHLPPHPGEALPFLHEMFDALDNG